MYAPRRLSKRLNKQSMNRPFILAKKESDLNYSLILFVEFLIEHNADRSSSVIQLNLCGVNIYEEITLSRFFPRIAKTSIKVI